MSTVDALDVAEVRRTYRDGHRRGQALAQLCRVHNARIPAAIFLVSGFAAGADGRTLTAGVVLIVASCGVAAAVNDRADLESDRINRRSERPLVGGALTDRDAVAAITVLSLVALGAVAALPQPNGAMVGAAAASIAWASACEPIHLQRRGYVGLAALGTAYLVLPILLATGLDQVLAVSGLALVGAGVLAHKDVRDEVGDRAAGKRTLLVRVGYPRMARLATLSASIGSAALVATLVAGWWCVPAAVTTVALATMAVRGHDHRTWDVARLALVALAIGVAWAAGSLAI